MVSSNETMHEAYGILKKSLGEAARAAGAVLSELIDLPDRPEEIITMFNSALVPQPINKN